LLVPSPLTGGNAYPLCIALVESALSQAVSRLIIVINWEDSKQTELQVNPQRSVASTALQRTFVNELYIEAYNFAVTLNRPDIDVTIIAGPLAAAEDVFLTTQIDTVFGLESDRVFVTQINEIRTKLKRYVINFKPLDNQKTIASFLRQDYYVYEDTVNDLPTYDSVVLGENIAVYFFLPICILEFCVTVS